MELEAQAIEAALPQKSFLIVLDERGKDLTTKALAQEMERWREGGQEIAIVIGGADGIAPRLKKAAQQQIRLSSLTLPHAMVRVLLLEQLFRSWSILTNHPYHRE
jgi:23S rRNA (pseudouridine1915-N3)-methyltransferase